MVEKIKIGAVFIDFVDFCYFCCQLSKCHDGAAEWRTEMPEELELQADLRWKDMLGEVKGELGTSRIYCLWTVTDIVFKMFPSSRLFQSSK